MKVNLNIISTIALLFSNFCITIFAVMKLMNEKQDKTMWYLIIVLCAFNFVGMLISRIIKSKLPWK